MQLNTVFQIEFINKSLVLVLFDHGPSVVIVDGLVIFRLHPIPSDLWMGVGLHRDVAYEVFHKDGVVVGCLGDVFFVRPFENAIELAAGAGLRQIDQFLDPYGIGESNGESHQSPLIMGTTGADGLGAGAEGGHWNFDGDNKVRLVGI